MHYLTPGCTKTYDRQYIKPTTVRVSTVRSALIADGFSRVGTDGVGAADENVPLRRSSRDVERAGVDVEFPYLGIGSHCQTS